MTLCNLNIANYIIRIESDDFDLVPGKRFKNFLVQTQTCENRIADLHLKVKSGETNIPAEAARVFHAPYVEEIDGIRLIRSPDFWSVWQKDDYLFIKTIFPESERRKTGLLKFSPGSNEWELNIGGDEKQVDPLAHPIDGLVLYYLTVIKGDIMIHASGINHNHKGYLFSGISGKGKTTMSLLWDNAGAKVIHDDRLIIRRVDDKYRMYNTPVYNNDEPRNSTLDRIYIIEHGAKNTTTRISGASAVSLVMANCIQHNWSPENISGLLGSVSELCIKIPIYQLAFTPDESVTRHISENG